MLGVSKERIISRFKYSLNELEFVYYFSKKSEITKSQEHLVNVADAIYEILEWTIKYVLFEKFDNPKIYKQERAIIEGNNFYKKFDLFIQEVNPSPNSLNIDCEKLKSLKASIRNKPKHSGYIPHFPSVVKALQEVKKILINYLDKECGLDEIPTEESISLLLEKESTDWIDFLDACDNFESTRNYILLIGPNDEFDRNLLRELGKIDWSFIIDFDPHTEIHGLYEASQEPISKRRKIHLFTCEDSQNFSPSGAMYWFAANGLQGRSSTITDSFRRWNRKYNKPISAFLEDFAKKVADRPTTLIILWHSLDYVRKICEIVDDIFEDSCRMIFALRENLEINAVANTYEGSIFNINLKEIVYGINKAKNYLEIKGDKKVRHLPHEDKPYVEITDEDYFWISEDMEVIHSNIFEEKLDVPGNSKDDFLKGHIISWMGLQLHHDVIREKTKSLEKIVKKHLRERRIIPIFLRHYPGIGGTTISRRILWNLYNEYPCVVLNRYAYQETINKIYRIYNLTRKPVFILVEASVIPIDTIQKFLNEIKSRNFPSTMLIVQRSESSKTDQSSIVYIPKILSDLEFRTFIETYKDAKIEKAGELEKLYNSSTWQEKHPFYIGLVAYEEQFFNLSQFVKKSINNLTSVQKRIISFLAMAYYYSQQSLSAQLFANLLRLPENKLVRLERYLSYELLNLLINEEEVYWRPIHHLVAKEILMQTLGNSSENVHAWKQNLSEYSIEFIQMGEKLSGTPSEKFLDILKKLFVLRDNEELLGKEVLIKESNRNFSALVTDIPIEEGRFRVFKELTNLFPDEPHFWAHLARYYSFERDEPDAAIYAINKALNISPNEDSLLYHMKGMCLRSKVYKDINNNMNNKDFSENALSGIKSQVEEIGSQFEKCRGIAPQNGYGYVSHIQLLIKVIDFGYSVSLYENKTKFLNSSKAEWFRKQLDLAESLLEDLKAINISGKDSYYINKCDLGIKTFYENYSVVIQGWNNLLQSKKYFNPPIRRQIVRTYLRRAKDWDKMSIKEIKSILNLMEDNIIEEPTNSKNIYFWFQAARYSDLTDLEKIIEKLSYWRSNSNSIQSIFYLYILYVLQAIDNLSLPKIKAEELIRESSLLARTLPNRTFCHEWLGIGQGRNRLVPNKLAGYRDPNGDFILKGKELKLINGRITKIKGPEAGELELECGLKAFFTPARGNDGAGYYKDKGDINRKVKFHLGFSYDGLRAWNVINCE